MREKIETEDYRAVQRDYNTKFADGGYENPTPFILSILKILQKFKPSGDRKLKLLDVGCGNGNFLQHAEKKYITYGLDISSKSIEIAKNRTKNTKLKASPAEKMKYPNNFFDIITCLGSLEHFINMENALSQMKRVLKNEGIAIIHVPNSVYLVHKILRIDTHGQINERFATEKEWKEILDKHFKIENVYKYNTKIYLRWIPKRYCCHFTFVCKKE